MADGGFLIADAGNNRVRRVFPKDRSTTRRRTVRCLKRRKTLRFAASRPRYQRGRSSAAPRSSAPYRWPSQPALGSARCWAVSRARRCRSPRCGSSGARLTTARRLVRLARRPPEPSPSKRSPGAGRRTPGKLTSSVVVMPAADRAAQAAGSAGDTIRTHRSVQTAPTWAHARHTQRSKYLQMGAFWHRPGDPRSSLVMKGSPVRVRASALPKELHMQASRSEGLHRSLARATSMTLRPSCSHRLAAEWRRSYGRRSTVVRVSQQPAPHQQRVGDEHRSSEERPCACEPG